MDIEYSKQYLTQLVKDTPRGYFHVLRKYNKDLVLYMKEVYGDEELSQLCYCFLNDICVIPRCKCGNKLHFIGINVGYKDKCESCYKLDRKQNSKKKMLLEMDKPKCKNDGCDNHVFVISNGSKLSDYCSFKCRGVHNSKKSRGKSRSTMLQKHGVEHALQSSDIMEKMMQHNVEKYGVKNAAMIYHEITKECIAFFDNKELLMETYKQIGVNGISDMFGVSASMVERNIKRHGATLKGGKSVFENEVKEFITKNYGGVVLHNKRDIIRGELDIFIPELNLAIECNGAYWHSELQGKDNTYHVNKHTQCENSGIKLIHVWHHDWVQKRSICENIILVNLHKIQRKIHGRKCVLKKIGQNEVSAFLEENHRQGKCPSRYNYALLHDGEIVQVITFGRSRFSTKYKYELLRLCTKAGVVVNGGASKLMKAFIDEVNPESIGTYADLSVNDGKVYQKMGFAYRHDSKPNYWYTEDYCVFYHRVKYQKHKLPKLLDHFDNKKTEWENMKAHGYDRVWDCGNSHWLWTKK